jgi:PAS domain S-box-containing protein
MTGLYNPNLVALSIAIAILASYTTLDLAARVTASTGGHRLAWLTGGSIAMGTGIWSMHYIGMLAFILPISVQYDWPTVLLSLLAAVFSSFVALSLATQKTLSLGRILAASVLMGGGIAGMHYIGMAAMRLQAICHWYQPVVVFSVVLAIAISFVALRFVLYFRDDHSRRFWKKLASSIAMGSAIPVMHYTGMAAVHFSSANIRPNVSHAISISSLGVISTTLISFVTLGLTLLLAVIDRRFYAQATELANSEQRYRELVESARVVLWRSDSEIRRFSFVSPEAETVLGYPTKRWLAEDSFWHDHVHPEDRDLVAARRAETVAGSLLRPFEHRMLSAAGETIWVRTALRLVETAKGQEVIGIMLDIGERKRAEEALQQERRLFDALMDASPDTIYFKDLASRFVRVNRAQSNRFGLQDPTLAIGKSDADFFTEPHAQQALADEQNIIATRQPLIDCEEKETWPDGRFTWVSTTKMPRLDADGNVCGTIGISRSITERRLVQDRLEERTQQLVKSNTDLQREVAERRLLEGQLVHAQKLESIGQLAAGIAHEINTPIQYVGDNCRFIEDSFQHLAHILNEYSTLLDAARESKFTPELVHKIEDSIEEADLSYLINEIPLALRQCNEGTERVALIVRALKEFSHPGSKEMKTVDLNRAVENTLVVCRNEWKLVADTVTRFDPSLPPVRCLADELNQVVLNLVVNAAHAIADSRDGETKGTITVSTRRDASFVEIRVQDDGTGIPEAIQSRIFDPFFTTKEVGRGTGQGLAISRNVVVKKHGGSLTFETAANVGTTFIVRVPIDGEPGNSNELSPELSKAGVFQ